MTTEAAGNLSETESESSSIMWDAAVASSFDSNASATKSSSPAVPEQLVKRVESLIQENRVLKMEVETFKARNRALQEENRSLKQASVLIQAKAEQEEEFIANTLLKQIQELKKEKEALALTYEQEEECLTNDLSRKLVQLKSEKAELTSTLKQEQEFMVGRLLKRLKKLEAETAAKQQHLEQLRREKVELENTLEQEQEALVNRLWKRMDKLENEKRSLHQKLQTTHSSASSAVHTGTEGGNQDEDTHVTTPTDANTNTASAVLPSFSSTDATSLSRHVQHLRNEVARLKQQLKHAQSENTERMQQMAREEQQIREENLRLQRRLQLEVERREQLCRNLSESESSLEIEDERYFNELQSLGTTGAATLPPYRSRTISSPLTSSPSAPGGEMAAPVPVAMRTSASSTGPVATIHGNQCTLPIPPPRCGTCGSPFYNAGITSSVLPVSPGDVACETRNQSHRMSSAARPVDSSEGLFLRPSKPSTPKSSSASSSRSFEGSPME